jgi:hypothetical protein
MMFSFLSLPPNIWAAERFVARNGVVLTDLLGPGLSGWRGLCRVLSERRGIYLHLEQGSLPPCRGVETLTRLWVAGRDVHWRRC